MNLTDAANFGAFIGGIATTLGLLGLLAIWLQWKDRTETQKAHEKTLIEKQRQHQENSLQNQIIDQKNRQIQIEINIISSAQSAYSSMMSERTRLYSDALSTPEHDVIRRNYLLLSASRVNMIFAMRLTSWITSLCEIEERILNNDHISLMASTSTAIAKEDRILLNEFAQSELNSISETLKNKDNEKFRHLYRISEMISISPIDHDKANSQIFPELAKAMRRLSDT